MPNNERIFFAVQAASFLPTASSTWTSAHGVQSVGITTTFDLEQVFELGQLAIYDLKEAIPNIEVTMEKALDGYPLLYHLATIGSPTGTLVGRSNSTTTFGLAVFTDTNDCASGTPIAQVVMSGLTISSLNYAFSTDSFSTESLTLVGFSKVWTDASGSFSGQVVQSGQFAGNADVPLATHGVQQRQDMIMGAVPSGTALDINGQAVYATTILPTDIYGISPDGTNRVDPTTGSFGAHISGITISADLGRDQILELGRKAPYFRFATFPIEVTTEITVVGTKWDGISATEAGGQNGAPLGSNLKFQSIRVAMDDGTYITTGTRNKLTSVGYSGGDASSGGGNVSLTFRYVTYNDLTVIHPADPTVALRGGATVQ